MLKIVRVCVLIALAEAANILIVVPTPSISHQVAFRPIALEMVKRGHAVTYITTDPVYPKGQAPANYTEIDIHDMSYSLWREAVLYSSATQGNSNDLINQIAMFNNVMGIIFEKQLDHPEVKKILSNETHFDLLIFESWFKPTFLFSHVFKNAPVILVSSFGSLFYNNDAIGAPRNPILLYSSMIRQKLRELTLTEKLNELYNNYMIEYIFYKQSFVNEVIVKKVLGPDAPSIAELEKNTDMLFLNVHPLWEMNRPVPPSVLYMGGVHQKPSKELPKELKQYLDSSKHGVIYISYGTNVSPSHLPPEKIQMLVNVFSKLPYDVLWKWDKDELPGRSKNIRISKWLPQSDLLKHPKVKLFVTQGGLQSTDEAITAGVPLIGMPMLGDQWFNVEQYLIHKVGLRVDMDTLTEENFLNAVNTIIKDDSYRKNIERLRSIMHDQPQTALERAVWWTEHLLRHGSGKHLRAPAANMTWAEYLDLELLAVLALGVLSILAVVVIALVLVVRTLRKVLGGGSKKLKRS